MTEAVADALNRAEMRLMERAEAIGPGRKSADCSLHFRALFSLEPSIPDSIYRLESRAKLCMKAQALPSE